MLSGVFVNVTPSPHGLGFGGLILGLEISTSVSVSNFETIDFKQ